MVLLYDCYCYISIILCSYHDHSFVRDMALLESSQNQLRIDNIDSGWHRTKQHALTCMIIMPKRDHTYEKCLWEPKNAFWARSLWKRAVLTVHQSVISIYMIGSKTNWFEATDCNACTILASPVQKQHVLFSLEKIAFKVECTIT